MNAIKQQPPSTSRLEPLQGRIAIVTGGASGIGRSTAIRLARDGASVLIADLQEDLAASASAEIRNAGGTALSMRCDVSKETDVISCVKTAVNSLGHVDILVNVAGGSSATRMNAEEMPLAEMERVFALNLFGAFLFVHHLLPLMRHRRYGRIVSISSTAASVTSDRTTPAYAASKAALGGLTRQLVFDYARYGITANNIAPGHVVTPLGLRMGADRLNSRIPMIPAGRLGTPEDVAAAVAFLVREDSGFVNGQTLTIDGGQTSVMNYAASLADEGST